jgi:hypothetical protein
VTTPTDNTDNPLETLTEQVEKQSSPLVPVGTLTNEAKSNKKDKLIQKEAVETGSVK